MEFTYRVLIIYRNLWSLVSLAHFISRQLNFDFSKHTPNTLQVNAYGFGVCFEMGKKCYRMSALYNPSIWIILFLSLCVCIERSKWHYFVAAKVDNRKNWIAYNAIFLCASKQARVEIRQIALNGFVAFQGRPKF